MVGEIVRENKYRIVDSSIPMKIFVIISMAVYLGGITWLGFNTFFDKMMIYLFIFSFNTGRSTITEAHKLLPLSDKEFKVFLVCRGYYRSIGDSLILVMLSIPNAVIEKRPENLLKVFVIGLMFASVMNNRFTYRGRVYFGLLRKICLLLIFLLIGLLVVSEIEPYSVMLSIGLCGIAVVFVVGDAFTSYLRIRKIPVAEMNFSVIKSNKKEKRI